jgi:hypothetical protein
LHKPSAGSDTAISNIPASIRSRRAGRLFHSQYKQNYHKSNL